MHTKGARKKNCLVHAAVLKRTQCNGESSSTCGRTRLSSRLLIEEHLIGISPCVRLPGPIRISTLTVMNGRRMKTALPPKAIGKGGPLSMCIRWKCLEREGKTVRTTTFSALLTPIY
jgi:hypothetical protein